MRMFVVADNGGTPNVEGIVGEYVPFPFPFRARDRWFIVAESMNAAPPGAFDIGDPLDDAQMSRTLTNPEANAVAQALGDPNTTYRGMTLRQVMNVLLNHPAGARCFQDRFMPEGSQAQAWDISHFDPGMFRQGPDRPVL